ncbi:hypothetical protein GGI43DRAFT_430563 [Trichoderma evansii]
MPQRPARREDFEVAILCALPLEYDAVALLFDEFWDKDGDVYGRAAGDLNTYTTGRIGKHDVVLALLCHMGKVNAASAAANMRSSYGFLRLVILAGICGGVPRGKDEIFLGDEVISSSVIQYDFGRHYPDGFIRKNTYEDNLRKHDKNIGGLLTKLRTSNGQDKLHERTAHFLKELRTAHFLKELQEKAVKCQGKAAKHREEYRNPGTAEDRLFESSYLHKHRGFVACICSKCHGRKDPVCDEAQTSSCDDLDCDEDYLVKRDRDKEEPAVYIGAVASGDTVMKSGEDRDRITKKEGVIAFEMEGAGVWEELPCIVVKGVCDYADCHKNKLWQNFAAATAASASKAILEQYIQTDRSRMWLVEDEEPPKNLFLVPFGRNQNFVGREAILSRLLEKIRPDANEDDCQRAAIEGLGGVGKTQIALEAIYLLHHEQLQHEHPECSIFWVPAVDATSFENAYRNIGKQLRIKGIDEDKADVKQLVKAALSAESSGSWLLVIDNVDDAELLFGAAGLSLSDHLPFSRNGSILFTTRNHEVVGRLDVPVDSIFSVTEMDGGEALSLLQKGLKESQTSNIKATTKLLDVLANLPLAIRQASAYMAKKRISTSDYLELCESEPKDMVSLLSKDFEDRHRYGEIQNPVATTWLISFSQVLHSDPLAAEYLKFMSILAEKDIPRSLLTKSKRMKGIDAIGTLKAYAFITHQEGDLFNMHQLVRLAMRNWLEKEEELEGCVASAMQRLDTVMSFPEHEKRDEWIKLLPHAQAVMELPEDLTSDQIKARLFAKLARGHELMGRYRIAEEIYRRAFELNEEMFGEDDPDTLADMNSVARMLRKLGKYKESEEIHRQILKIDENNLGKDHPDTLGDKSNLAVVLMGLGKYEELEEIYRQILEINENDFGKDHPDTLRDKSNLALVLRRLGKYDEAEKLHREVLEVEEKTLDKDHPDLLSSVSNLALVFEGLGKYEEAEKMFRKAFETREKRLGADHPHTLDNMSSLALVLEDLGRYDEAEQMFRQALELREKVLGKDHPYTLESMNSLALVFEDLGKYEEAEQLFRQTIELQEKVLGKDHPYTRKSRDDLANCLKEKSKKGVAAWSNILSFQWKRQWLFGRVLG